MHPPHSLPRHLRGRFAPGAAEADTAHTEEIVAEVRERVAPEAITVTYEEQASEY